MSNSWVLVEDEFSLARNRAPGPRQPHVHAQRRPPAPGQTFRQGLDFIHRNRDQDNWFLHIETLDPHEPFLTQQKYKDLCPHDYDGPQFDWPTHRRHLFSLEEMRTMQAAPTFTFTKGCPTMRIDGAAEKHMPTDSPVWSTMLFDLQPGGKQAQPIRDKAIEQRMLDHLVRLMKQTDAPSEQFERLGL